MPMNDAVNASHGEFIDASEELEALRNVPDHRDYKTIAVDFDGCLCTNAWPGIGAPNTELIESLKRRRETGDKLILWTCREGALLDVALEWCRARGLAFDAANENLPEMVERYGGDCRKISADEYWDDKAVNVRA